MFFNRVRSGAALLALAFGVLTMITGGWGAPAPEGNNFRFSILGDRTGSAVPEVYGRVWREIDLLHPDFVINVGDTIEGGNDAGAAAEWGQIRQAIERYNRYPLFHVAGNHDIWSASSRKTFQEQTGRPAFYSFNFQNAHITVLDNSETLELSPNQLKFLENDLKANRSRDPKFVFFHKPYWMVFLKLGSGEFPLHRIARTYGVDYIVSGHAHQFFRYFRDGITYLGVGSSGASLSRGAKKGEGFREGWFFQHVWVAVTGQEARLTVKELDGAQGRGRMFPADEWGPDGPAFDVEDPGGRASRN